MKPKARALGLGLILAALTIAAACARDPSVDIVAPDGHRRARVEVEIADSPARRETGLMYRDRLAPDSGMIFIFRAPGRLQFWMKNTRIPLDMIFADGDGKIVGIVADAEPFNETPRGADSDAQYVLEVNGGFAAAHHISPGDRMVFHGFTARAAN